MKLINLYILLKNIGYPVAYHHFNEQTSTPYLVYFEEGRDDFQADNINYFPQSQIVVEFYFTEKSEAIEEEIESIFMDKKIPFDLIERWIDEEKVFQRSYTFTLKKEN